MTEDERTDQEIRHRTRVQQCPQLCQRFNCILADNCHDECKKLDTAKALICELCDKDCTDKQKILMLNTSYYDQKKKEFSQHIIEGINEVKVEHKILERKYMDLKRKLLELKWYEVNQKPAIVKEGNRVVMEILIMRKIMDMLHMTYEVEVDLEGKGK